MDFFSKKEFISKIIFYAISDSDDILQHLKLVNKKWYEAYHLVVNEFKSKILGNLMNRNDLILDSFEDEDKEENDSEESFNYMNIVYINNKPFVLYSGFFTAKEFRNFSVVELYYVAYKHNLIVYSPDVSSIFFEMINSEKDVKFKSFVYEKSSTVKEAKIIESFNIQKPSKFRINMSKVSIKTKTYLSKKEILLFRQYYQSKIFRQSLEHPLISFEENYQKYYQPFINPPLKLATAEFLVRDTQRYRLFISKLNSKQLLGIENRNYLRQIDPSVYQNLGFSKKTFAKLIFIYRRLHNIKVQVKSCDSLDYLFDSYILNNQHLLSFNKKSKSTDIEDLKNQADAIVLEEYGIENYFDIHKSSSKISHNPIFDRINKAKQRIKDLFEFLKSLEADIDREKNVFEFKVQLDALSLSNQSTVKPGKF